MRSKSLNNWSGATPRMITCEQFTPRSTSLRGRSRTLFSLTNVSSHFQAPTSWSVFVNFLAVLLVLSLSRGCCRPFRNLFLLFILTPRRVVLHNSNQPCSRSYVSVLMYHQFSLNCTRIFSTFRIRRCPEKKFQGVQHTHASESTGYF